jgi:predicted small metal-binding protein
MPLPYRRCKAHLRRAQRDAKGRDAMKTLACKDMGMQCNWVGRAQTEQELLRQATEHAKNVHKMNPTPEMEQMARKVMHEE